MNYVRVCICLASVLPTPAACPLKCHALKRCTFWRETCLASAIALRLVNQRARAANQRARASKLGNKSTRSVLPFKLRLRSFSWNRTIRSGICLASALLSPPAPPLKCHALKRCTSWRETCLASVFALRLANQRARAATRCARALHHSIQADQSCAQTGIAAAALVVVRHRM